MQALGAERTVQIVHEKTSFCFGWRENIPSKDFVVLLRDAVRHATGLSKFDGIEMQVRGGETVWSVTPRDLFEGKVSSGTTVWLVLKGAVMAAPELRQQSPPLRPTGDRKYQKGGGSQMQFMQLLAGNSSPAKHLPAGLQLTAEEVGRHRKPGDAWTIFQGKVYDMTSYIDFHPGGKGEIMKGAGKDMTELFFKAHSWVSFDALLGKLCLGPLVCEPSSLPAPSPTLCVPPGVAADANQRGCGATQRVPSQMGLPVFGTEVTCGGDSGHTVTEASSVPAGRSSGRYQRGGGSQLQFMQLTSERKRIQVPEGVQLTLEEVAKHRKPRDCWSVFQGKVYDITLYIEFHPGGKGEIMKGGGKDMTDLFLKAHPWVSAEGILGKLCLGPLVRSQPGQGTARSSATLAVPAMGRGLPRPAPDTSVNKLEVPAVSLYAPAVVAAGVSVEQEDHADSDAS